MTTQEQLKIFAAYLPYGLELQIEDETETEYTMFLGEMDSIMPGKAVLAGITKETSFMPECLLFTRNDGEPDGYIQLKNAKPILYDLSHLTKEIEHEGERVNMQERMQHLDFEWLIGNPKLAAKLNQEDFETLVKYHFNVFGLPAGDFIDKSTLKTESNDKH